MRRLHFITGGAGFVGVNLARALLDRGDAVVAADDLSRGRRAFLAPFDGREDFRFMELDCSDIDALGRAIDTSGTVTDIWHLAANSDIPAGIADPGIDLRQTFLTTFAVARVAASRSVRRVHFASSSAIYGDLGDREIVEDIGPLEPISNYGAMKLASEAQLRAACEASGLDVSIFRFPNVIGTPATHGVILDFVQKLQRTPDRLDVLGDGTQQKAYLHVDDLIDAMLHISALPGPWRVFNIGPNDLGITVREIAKSVRDAAAPEAAIHYGIGNKGWVGDVPRFAYSVARLTASGWVPKLNSGEAVRRAVAEIVAQERAR